MRRQLTREEEYNARPPHVMYVHTPSCGTYAIHGGFRALKRTDKRLRAVLEK